ncbi:glycoside hydrolase family 31, partial [mine drainage metagenome]
FYHLADGRPTQTNEYPGNQTGSNIDMTDPAAARWFWRMIDQHLIRRGFSAIWADETEPDIPPNGSYFHIGPGTEYFNVYPLFETSAIYQGHAPGYPAQSDDSRARGVHRRAAQWHDLLVLGHHPRRGIRCNGRFPPDWTWRPRAFRTGPTTWADSGACRRWITRCASR